MGGLKRNVVIVPVFLIHDFNYKVEDNKANCNVCNTLVIPWQYLGWMELKSGREYLSIIQLFKFINGFSRVKLDNYLSFSRASTRSRNSRKIWKPFSRTNILKFSFWQRYIDKWNSLPDSLNVPIHCQNLKRA